MMIKILAGALAFSLVIGHAHADGYTDEKASGSIPHSFDSVVENSMGMPLAMFYSAEVAYKKGEHSEALKWYLEAAKKIHEPSVENAKYMIQANEGVVDNRTEVVEFLTYYGTPTGLSSGDLFAQLYLGDYFSGHACVWVNFGDSARSSATQCLNVDSQSSPMTEKDYTKAYYWFTSAAEQGSPRAKYTLAMMDILGIAGARNIRKGMTILQEVADEGYASADYILGMMHNEGYWIEQDPERANEHFSRAAEANLPQAQLVMADNFVARRGVAMESGLSSAELANMYYQRVLNNLLASPKQMAKAHFEIAEIARLQRGQLSPDQAFTHYHDAIELSEQQPNVYSLQAASALGDLAVEADDMSTALNYYEMAEAMLPALDHAERKQHASILQSIANLHARGANGLSPNERKYAAYMTKFHNLRASESMNATQPLSLFGEHAFEFSY